MRRFAPPISPSIGLEPEQQSSLNFLGFIHADRRSKFTPLGSPAMNGTTSSTATIASSLDWPQALPRPVELGMKLEGVRETAAGRVELTFDTPAGVVSRTHDAVVLAIPFTTLRAVALDIDLDRVLGSAARSTILVRDERQVDGRLQRRPWIDQGGNGTAYADLAKLICVWETNPARATSARGVLTDYSGGARGAAMDPAALQFEAREFLADLNFVFPGALAPRGAWMGTSSLISSTGRQTRWREAATHAICRGSSRRSPVSRGCRLETCSSPASMRTRSTIGKASWKGRRCLVWMPPRRFCKRSKINRHLAAR